MTTGTSQNTKAKKLVDELAARLTNPLVLEEPFVLQDRTPQTRSRHVLVVWDAWKNLDRQSRSTIIMDAFSEANILEGDTVRVALGLTQEEALEMGYLPFKIVTTHREEDSVTIGKLKKALESVGGVHVRAGKSHQLRFPSEEYAQEAYRQLTEKVPGPYWAIVHEVTRD